MAESALIINTKISTADTVTKIYDSPGGGSGTVISALTVTNDSSASASYKIYILSVYSTNTNWNSGSSQCPGLFLIRDLEKTFLYSLYTYSISLRIEGWLGNYLSL